MLPATSRTLLRWRQQLVSHDDIYRMSLHDVSKQIYLGCGHGNNLDSEELDNIKACQF